MAAPITRPISGRSNQYHAIAPVMTANRTPLNRPTRSSLLTKRQALAEERSFMASARTSATTFSMVPSNRPMTSEARIAVARFTTSQGLRARTVSSRSL